MLSVSAYILVVFSACLFSLFTPKPVYGRSWASLFHKVDLCKQALYSEIVPGLYLSNARAACSRDILRRLRITHVLTIEARPIPKEVFDQMDITTLFIKAFDTPGTNLLPYFPMSNRFIAEGLARGAVLVHCHFGVSRSATLVIAYMMETYRMSYADAFAYVQSRRSFINPNVGFVNQLKEYERFLPANPGQGDKQIRNHASRLILIQRAKYKRNTFNKLQFN